jgi:hypothetical protein
LFKRGFSKNEALLSSEISEVGEDSFEDSISEESFVVSLSYESEELFDKKISSGETKSFSNQNVCFDLFNLPLPLAFFFSKRLR